MGENSLQVAKGEVLVDGESLDLVYTGRMGRVELVSAEHAPRYDQIDRWIMLLHVPGLHRRCVRAQEDAFGIVAVVEIERVALKP